jgi:hypothetical protein
VNFESGEKKILYPKIRVLHIPINIMIDMII